MNRKKVQRQWREEGLRGATEAPQAPAPRRLHHALWAAAGRAARSRVGARLPVRPHRDRQDDQDPDVVDEFTRESLADLVHHGIDADATVACLDEIVGRRGRHPAIIRCNNGPELTANTLRDWCRFSGAGAAYIEPGSPWENPWVESYGSRMRDELLGIEQFDTLLEAQVPVADWRTEYNTYGPALGMLTPVEFADQWRRTNPPKLS